MNIAILSYEYPPDTGFGGIGTYAYYQARGLVKLGHSVHVFAGSTEMGIHHSEHDGVRVTRIKQDGWVHGATQGLRDRRCWWATNRTETAYSAYYALRKAMERETFDVVEFPECGADGALVTTLLDIPSAVKFHSPARLIMDIYDTPKMDREVTAFLEQIAINQSDIRTSCSQFLADEVMAKMNVAAPVHVIPNGIDLELFDRDEGIDVTERFGVPAAGGDKVTVFFANRMEKRKGIHLVRDMCFHVMRKYPHVHFVFAGADLFGYMEKQILPFIKSERMQDRFHYVGKIDLPSVRALLKRSDIFLIPSLWENCPYSCIEAMSAGRAIVSSDCGGMPELIRDGDNGLLATNDNAPSFISALERAVEDAALRERLGAAARREVESRLTDVAVAERAATIYADFRS